jgi:hypothetical protein
VGGREGDKTREPGRERRQRERVRRVTSVTPPGSPIRELFGQGSRM